MLKPLRIAFELYFHETLTLLFKPNGILNLSRIAKRETHPDQSAKRKCADPLSVSGLTYRVSRIVRQVGENILIAARRWQTDDASVMAASVAYYMALSLFPMFLLLIAGVGLVMRFTQLGHDAEEQVLKAVSEHGSATVAAQVQEVLAQLRDHSVASGPIGLAAALMAVIGVFQQVEKAFDKIYRVPAKQFRSWKQQARHFISKRIAAFSLFIGVGLAILATLITNVIIGTLRQWMAHVNLPGTLPLAIVDAGATIGINAFAFASLYRWLPKKPIVWSDAIRGGLLASVMWEILREFLCTFLIGMKYTSAYGAIGSFIALLLWFYWGMMILFFGAEYVQVLSRRRTPYLRMFNAQQPEEVDSESHEESELAKIVPRRANLKQAA